MEGDWYLLNKRAEAQMPDNLDILTLFATAVTYNVCM